MNNELWRLTRILLLSTLLIFPDSIGASVANQEDLTSVSGVDKRIAIPKPHVKSKDVNSTKRQRVIHAINEENNSDEPDDIESLGKRIDETGKEIKEINSLPLSEQHVTQSAKFIISKIKEIQEKLFKRTGSKDLEEKLNQMSPYLQKPKNISSKSNNSVTNSSLPIPKTSIKIVNISRTTPSISEPKNNTGTAEGEKIKDLLKTPDGSKTGDRRKIIPEEVVDKILEKFQQLKKEAKHIAITESQHEMEKSEAKDKKEEDGNFNPYASIGPAKESLKNSTSNKDVTNVGSDSMSMQSPNDQNNLGNIQIPLGKLPDDNENKNNKPVPIMFIKNGETLVPVFNSINSNIEPPSMTVSGNARAQLDGNSAVAVPSDRTTPLAVPSMNIPGAGETIGRNMLSQVSTLSANRYQNPQLGTNSGSVLAKQPMGLGLPDQSPSTSLFNNNQLINENIRKREDKFERFKMENDIQANPYLLTPNKQLSSSSRCTILQPDCESDNAITQAPYQQGRFKNQPSEERSFGIGHNPMSDGDSGYPHRFDSQKIPSTEDANQNIPSTEDIIKNVLSSPNFPEVAARVIAQSKKEQRGSHYSQNQYSDNDTREAKGSQNEVPDNDAHETQSYHRQYTDEDAGRSPLYQNPYPDNEAHMMSDKTREPQRAPFPKNQYSDNTSRETLSSPNQYPENNAHFSNRIDEKPDAHRSQNQYSDSDAHAIMQDATMQDYFQNNRATLLPKPIENQRGITPQSSNSLESMPDRLLDDISLHNSGQTSFQSGNAVEMNTPTAQSSRTIHEISLQDINQPSSNNFQGMNPGAIQFGMHHNLVPGPPNSMPTLDDKSIKAPSPSPDEYPMRREDHNPTPSEIQNMVRMQHGNPAMQIPSNPFDGPMPNVPFSGPRDSAPRSESVVRNSGNSPILNNPFQDIDPTMNDNIAMMQKENQILNQNKFAVNDISDPLPKLDADRARFLQQTPDQLLEYAREKSFQDQYQPNDLNMLGIEHMDPPSRLPSKSSRSDKRNKSPLDDDPSQLLETLHNHRYDFENTPKDINMPGRSDASSQVSSYDHTPDILLEMLGRDKNRGFLKNDVDVDPDVMRKYKKAKHEDEYARARGKIPSVIDPSLADEINSGDTNQKFDIQSKSIASGNSRDSRFLRNHKLASRINSPISVLKDNFVQYKHGRLSMDSGDVVNSFARDSNYYFRNLIPRPKNGTNNESIKPVVRASIINTLPADKIEFRVNGKKVTNNKKTRRNKLNKKSDNPKGETFFSNGPIQVEISHGLGKQKIVNIVTPNKFNVTDDRKRARIAKAS